MALGMAFDLRLERIGGCHPLDGYALAFNLSRNRKRRML